MKKINIEYFEQNISSEQPLDSIQSNIKELDDIQIDELDISTKKIISIRFNNCEWNHVNAVATEFINVEFNNCKINESNFHNSKFINVIFNECIIFSSKFHKSDFTKVKFNKSKIVDNKLDFYKGFSFLKKVDVEFYDSELINLTFFKSSGNFTFTNTLFSGSKMAGLIMPSSIIFDHSIIEGSDFSDSNLTSFTVKNTEVKDAKLNNATVDKIVIEDSKLDFAMADSTFNSIKISNTDNVILGGSKFNTLMIENCKNNGDISIDETVFKEISIRNCPLLLLDSSDSKGEKLTITDMEIKSIDFSNFIIKDLIFTNVRMTENVKFNNAQAEETQMTNVSIATGTKVNMTGTNISFQ